jgi:hypothetical protein
MKGYNVRAKNRLVLVIPALLGDDPEAVVVVLLSHVVWNP